MSYHLYIHTLTVGAPSFHGRGRQRSNVFSRAESSASLPDHSEPLRVARRLLHIPLRSFCVFIPVLIKSEQDVHCVFNLVTQQPLQTLIQAGAELKQRHSLEV